MDLYEESQFINNNNNNASDKKVMLTITILLIILLFIALGIIFAIKYLNKQELKLYIDGKKNSFSSNMFVVENDDVYVSIDDIAQKIGYASNNGEYKRKFEEDATKRYLDNNYETASYILDSKVMYKKLAENSSEAYKSDYEYYDLNKPVREINGKLYVELKDLEQGCNIATSYDSENHKIDIYTLPYLVQTYTAKVTDAVTTEERLSFENQKAILYNMIVVKDDSDRYGVSDLSGKTIIGKKYKEIIFIEGTQEFVVVTEEDKVGIINKKAETQIEPEYSSIRLIDDKEGIYVVSKNHKYGIVDNKGSVQVFLEYDSIGIPNADVFQADNIENKYILYGKYIPVQKDNKWGLLDLHGNTKVKIEYDSLGCEITTAKDATAVNSLLLIPEYEAIVVCKDKQYGVFGIDYYEKTAKLLIETAVTDIYSVKTGGKKEYYLTYRGNKMHVINYIKTVVGVNPINEEANDNDFYQDRNNQNTENNNNNVENTEQNNIEQPNEAENNNQTGTNTQNDNTSSQNGNVNVQVSTN